MRLLPRLTLAAVAVAVLSGCGELAEVGETVDRAQACLEATGVVTEIGGKLTELRDNPERLEQALADAAAKLTDAAAKAGDTTLREALEGLADAYRNLDISDVNSAVDAARKAVADTARYGAEITAACSEAATRLG